MRECAQGKLPSSGTHRQAAIDISDGAERQLSWTGLSKETEECTNRLTTQTGLSVEGFVWAATSNWTNCQFEHFDYNRQCSGSMPHSALLPTNRALPNHRSEHTNIQAVIWLTLIKTYSSSRDCHFASTTPPSPTSLLRWAQNCDHVMFVHRLRGSSSSIRRRFIVKLSSSV